MRTWLRLGAPVALLAAIGALLGSATPAAASIQFDGQWGSASLPPPLGPADGSFSTPSRAATDASNNVYVTDSGNSRVQKFNSAGTFLSKFGTLGTGNGQFLATSATGIAVDSAGNVYVVDKLSNRVQKFNSAGTFVTAWGSAGTGNGQFTAPTGIVKCGIAEKWLEKWSPRLLGRKPGTMRRMIGVFDAHAALPFGR